MREMRHTWSRGDIRMRMGHRRKQIENVRILNDVIAVHECSLDWVVTHISTGCAIVKGCSCLSKAKKAAVQLMEIRDFDWKRDNLRKIRKIGREKCRDRIREIILNARAVSAKKAGLEL